MENKNEFPRGQLNPSILSALLEKDKYGYEIIEDVKQKTGIEIKQPTLYSSLKRMETQKYISSYWQDSEIGGKRHYYCLTAIGKDFLAKNPIDTSLFKPAQTIEIVSVKDNKTTDEEILQTSKNVDLSEQPRFARQDNIFNAINIEKAEERLETEEKLITEKAEENIVKTDDFMQYDLFESIKKEEIKPKEEIAKTRNLHNKNSSDPYQLKYLSEDDLKNEFDRIRNQKEGIISKSTAVSDDQKNAQVFQQNSQPSAVVEKAEQSSPSNVWLSRNNYINSQNIKKEEISEIKEQTEEVKEEQKIVNNEEKEIRFAKVAERIEPVRDDGRFITERINVENIPRQRSTPSLLNIESANYSSFLNSRIATKESEKAESKEVYNQRNDIYTESTPKKYNFGTSLANLESKFEKHAANKNLPEPENRFDKMEKVENTYERVKNSALVFNSYKSLESYFNSKGIGFHSYNKRDKSAEQYVDFDLIKLIRGAIFSLYAIVLAIAFYCGINYPSIGKISYIIFPVLALALSTLYAVNYHKSKSNTIIQMEKAVVSPIILPVISACAILVVIAINLIIGFHHGNALHYFPILIYPICLCLHIAVITSLNRFIKFCVLKYRNYRLNKK